MIVVTGGAGFIGSNIVREIGARGLGDVTVVDRLTDAKMPNLVGAPLADYVDRDDFLRLLDRDAPELGDVHLVIHQGACSSTTEPDSRHVMAMNHDYSKRLVRWCVGAGVPLVYASSAAVYGAGPGFSEDSADERPLNVYGLSKLLVDRYVRRMIPSAGSQLVGLRYFNVYGPGEDHKGPMRSVVAQLDDELRVEGTATIFGASHGRPDGGQERDFVLVDDVVDVVLWFAEHPDRSGIFNVGTGRPRTFLDLASAVVAARGTGRVGFRPFPAELTDRYQAWTCADLGRLRAAGYEREFTSLEDGVASYLARRG